MFVVGCGVVAPQQQLLVAPQGGLFCWFVGVGGGVVVIGVVVLFVWCGHVHVLFDCLYCCIVVVVQDLCTQCGVV